MIYHDGREKKYKSPEEEYMRLACKNANICCKNKISTQLGDYIGVTMWISIYLKLFVKNMIMSIISNIGIYQNKQTK